MLGNFSSRDKVRRTVVNFVVPFLKRRRESVKNWGLLYLFVHYALNVVHVQFLPPFWIEV
jgi:hypothetical protein